MQIAYFSDFDAQLGLRRLFTQPTALLSSRALVNLRANIDGFVDTLQTGSPYANVAQLEFTGSSSSVGQGRRSPAGRSIAAANSHWAPDAIFEARSIKFELPLENGDTPFIVLRPQEAAFKQFSQLCNGDLSASQGRRYDPLEISGTAATFASRFPAALERAASENGLDPRDLIKEEKYVIEAVRRCAAITPQLALSNKDRDAFERSCFDGYSHASGMADENWDDKRQWGVEVQFVPPNGSWKNQGPFKVGVALKPPKNQPGPPYTFVLATIERSE